MGEEQERQPITPAAGGGEERGEVEVTSGGELRPERIEIPPTLPVLPLKNTVLFPALLAPLLVNTARSQRLIDHVLVTPERLLLACAVRRPVEGSPGPDDVYPVGTVLRVARMMKFPDGSYRLLVQGVARGRIDGFTEETRFLEARVSALEEVGDPRSVEVAALSRSVSQGFQALVAEHPKLSDELQVIAANLEDPSRLADLVAHNLEIDVAGKQAVLEQLDVEARLRKVLDDLTRSREAMTIESEIRDRVQSEMGKTQRDYMLRQQMEAIRRELGESEESESEVASLRERIDAAGLAAGGPGTGEPRARAPGDDAAGGGRTRRDPQLSGVDGRSAMVEA